MTKKDYKVIAELILAIDETHIDDAYNKNYEYGSGFNSGFNSALESIVYGLCKVFEEDNERFNAEIFIRACGF